MTQKVFSDEVRQSMTEKRLRTCIHFNGTKNEVCKVGVNYETVRDYPPETENTGTPFIRSRLACLSEEFCRIVCEKKELWTIEEINAQIDKIEIDLRQRSEDYKNNICPTHKIPITKRQIGRCIYAEPCGCRLGQGQLSGKKKKDCRR